MDIKTTLAGKLKLLTLLLGGLSVALVGPSLCNHTTSTYRLTCADGSFSKEQYFLAISCIALILSTILVTATVLNVFLSIRRWHFDTGYHLLMACLLLVGWIVFLVSVNCNHKSYTPQLHGDIEYISFMAKRCFALIFQLLNILVYSFTVFLVFTNRNHNDEN